MADKTCTNCAYFHPTDKDRLAGECRNKPPQVWFMGADRNSSTSWPKVDALDWCGQFMSRENLYEKKKEEMTREVFISIICVALLGCGTKFYSATTEASYETTIDGKKITYESSKEFQGLILEVTDNSVKITVDKASTSEAAIAAALQMQLNLQQQLMRLIDQLAPLAAAAAKAGS